MYVTYPGSLSDLPFWRRVRDSGSGALNSPANRKKTRVNGRL